MFLLTVSLLFRRPDYMPIKMYFELKDVNLKGFQKYFI